MIPNTRYLKLIRKIAVALVLVLVTMSMLSMKRWSAEATGFNRRYAGTDNSIPSLQRAAAITYLKAHKLYESLRVAHAARIQQGDNSVLAPLFVDEQKLTASDGAAFDEFGWSVAISGSTVVVGAWDHGISGNRAQGSAYVFNRQGGGWVETQKLTASDGATNDNFGWSVAISGSTIVIGAWGKMIGGNPAQGSAYVFNRQGGSWTETQKLTASDGGVDSDFGYSVAFSGSTLVVSAPGDDFTRGSAYVFNRQGGSWVEEQKLTPSGGWPVPFFGQSVAVSGLTIVVGASGDNFLQGSAYVFNRQRGKWVETQKLTASDGAANDEFGFSVAITDSTLVVSSPFHEIGGNPVQGSAYVFNRQRESWVEGQKLTASDGGREDGFGRSVAVSGSIIVVGEPFESMNGDVTGGSAYVFNRQGGSWVEKQKLTAIDGGLFPFFGESVAVSGSTVVVGAYNSGDMFQGSAYVFEP